MSACTLEETERAFYAITSILHNLRPKLWAVVPQRFLVHPAYVEKNFPIHWQGEQGFLQKARPPCYVRFSHHPLTASATPRGHSCFSCFSTESEDNVQELRNIIIAAYENEIGKLQQVDVELVGVQSYAAFRARATFHLPIHLDWRIV